MPQPHLSSIDDSPLFIIGSGRCGTTMLAELLGRFTGIAVTPETHFVTKYLSRLEHFGDLSEPANRLKLCDAIAREPRYKLLKPAWDGATLAAESWSDYGDLLRMIYGRFAAAQGKQRWADQTPFYGLHLDTLAARLAEAKFVHLIRDGRDCALSVMRTYWGPTNMYRAALWWRDAMQSITESGCALDDSRYLEVRYEDLLSRPLEQMQKICDFAGEPMTDRLAAVCRGGPGAEYRLKRRNTDKWRIALGADQIRIFEALAGAELEKSGYPRFYPGARVSGRMIRWCYRVDHRIRSLPANVSDVMRWARRLAA